MTYEDRLDDAIFMMKRELEGAFDIHSIVDSLAYEHDVDSSDLLDAFDNIQSYEQF